MAIELVLVHYVLLGILLSAIVHFLLILLIHVLLLGIHHHNSLLTVASTYFALKALERLNHLTLMIAVAHYRVQRCDVALLI